MNIAAAKLFSQVILAEKTVRIKLLGDSITHGVGGTGFAQNGEPITDGFSRNPEGHCWANMFKAYLESQYDSTVINNACTGTNIEFVIAHFDELVDVEDDIVICVIGTNNRHQHFWDGPKRDRRVHMEMFYRNILALHEKFIKADKKVIFAANIPATAEDEKDGGDYWRIMHMNDICDLYTKASLVCGFPLIRLYTSFLEYCEQQNISVASLLPDGIHPNDDGHVVICRLMMKDLGIAPAV